MTEENIKIAFEFCNKIAENEQNNYQKLFDFITKFKRIYDTEKQNLPYHINLIDELHANENAHSRILGKLLKQKTHNGTFELFESFIEYLKEKGKDKDKEDFSKIEVEKPQITQEKKRIDLWIRDKSYAIVLENKVKWAGDQHAQIDRYIDVTKNYGFSEDKIFVIYLPPTYEKEPEQQSWGKYYENDIHKNRYLNLSFRGDIIVWLKEKVLPDVKLKDVYLRSAIEQYIDHLEGIFSLRTINNKMNMELQKFIESELKLSEQEPVEALQTIYEKQKALQDIIVQLQTTEMKYKKCCFEKWEKQLKKDFPNAQIISTHYNFSNYPKIGVDFSYQNHNFSALNQYHNNFLVNALWVKAGEKDESVKNLLQSILFDSYTIDENTWFYGWKQTDFQTGYEDLKALIASVLEILPQQ
jgi:hypothetical protein